MEERKLTQREIDIAMAMAIVCDENDWGTLNEPTDASCQACEVELGNSVPNFCPNCGTEMNFDTVVSREGYTIDYDTAIILLDAFKAAMKVVYSRGDHMRGTLQEYDTDMIR